MTGNTGVSVPPSVALLLESDGPGGAEQTLLLLAEALREAGHDVCPIGPSDGCGWLAEHFRDRGFLPETFTLRRPVDWQCVQGLSQVLRDRCVEVVHSHEFTMAIYGAAASRLCHLPHIATLHGGRYYARRLRRRVSLRWALKHSHAAVVVSRALRDDLCQSLRLPEDAVSVVYNGVPGTRGSGAAVRSGLGIRESEILVLAVGNLYPVKGHATLIRGLAECRDNTEHSLKLAIAGRGGEEKRLLKLAVELGLTEQVALLGYRDDVSDLMAAADLFVMPSFSEGLPLALLEAMFAGKAILASNVGGIPEATRDGKEAVLVPPGDPSELANGLRRLLSSDSLRRQLGTQARYRAEAFFSIDAMTQEYRQLYDRALGAPTGHEPRWRL